MKKLLAWDIYEITTKATSINWVMLRGRIRKFWPENNMNVLAENTQDIDASVRFALLTWESPDQLIAYLTSIIEAISITRVLEEVKNPVLSKLKVNREERYEL